MLKCREAEGKKESETETGGREKRAQQQIIFAPLPSKLNIHMSILYYDCQVCGGNKTEGPNNGKKDNVQIL